MKKKFHINWFYVSFAALLLMCVAMFVNYGLAYAEPAKYNWRLEYLPAGAATDTYLHEAETIIALVFAILACALAVFGFLDLLLRKKSSHILLVEAMTLTVLAYDVTRMIYCFRNGSETTLVGIIYAVASVGTALCVYAFLKKAWDGDHLGSYWAFFLIAIVANLFGGMVSSSYSILNAFVHMNSDTHLGDFTYWFGYGANRIMTLFLGLAGWINVSSDYCPESKEGKVEAL